MTDTNPLPEYLFPAYEWIDSAGEWDAALADPSVYAEGAKANAIESGCVDVNATDLREVIEWMRADRRAHEVRA